MYIKRREGKKGYATLLGSFGCQYRKLEIRSRLRVQLRSLTLYLSLSLAAPLVYPATLTRSYPRQPLTIVRGCRLRKHSVIVQWPSTLLLHINQTISITCLLCRLSAATITMSPRGNISKGEPVYVRAYRRASLSRRTRGKFAGNARFID